MKWMPKGMGAEPWKVGVLVTLLAAFAFTYDWGGSASTPAAPTVPKSTRASLPIVEPSIPRPAPRAAARGGNEDFHPTLKLPDDFDLSKVDPTLRTDLLARVREVGEVGGTRSLFEFYTPPLPPPKVDAIKPTAPPPPPAETKPAAPVKVVPPPPPPIPLKYFGYEGTPRGGTKLRALFVDGEENFIVGENDTIRNRYRIVRIGTTSAEVEDTTSKNTQTLRILERQDP